MVDTRVSDEEFSLDTKSFDGTAASCKKLAKQMENLKNDMDGLKANLMFSWVGAGRDVFEKKYRILSQQFGDIGDSLMEIAESIYDMEEEYIQTDTNVAKSLKGIDSRY